MSGGDERRYDEETPDFEKPYFAGFTGAVLNELNKQKLLPITAIPTPLPKWNEHCRDEGGGIGLALGWHVVIAGATGVGKSLLALNIAAAAIRHGTRVGYISLEMSEQQTATRLQSVVSGIPVIHLEHGKEFDMDRATEAAACVERIRQETGGLVFCNNLPLFDLTDIRAAFRVLVEDGCKMIITDYMQLAWTDNWDSLLKQVTEVSHKLRHLSRTLNVVSVGVSQLNRETAKGEGKPVSQGLYGGGPLENDADQVLIFDHTSFKQTTPETAEVDLLITKNRHGATGSIKCLWNYDCLRLEQRLI